MIWLPWRRLVCVDLGRAVWYCWCSVNYIQYLLITFKAQETQSQTHLEYWLSLYGDTVTCLCQNLNPSLFLIINIFLSIIMMEQPALELQSCLMSNVTNHVLRCKISTTTVPWHQRQSKTLAKIHGIVEDTSSVFPLKSLEMTFVSNADHLQTCLKPHKCFMHFCQQNIMKAMQALGSNRWTDGWTDVSIFNGSQSQRARGTWF